MSFFRDLREIFFGPYSTRVMFSGGKSAYKCAQCNCPLYYKERRCINCGQPHVWRNIK